MGRTIISDDGYFEWDEDKAKTNENKHGIAFERALSVFFDPKRIEFRDERNSKSEDRYITIGNASKSTLFLVIVSSTERNGRIRLISMRRASKHEEGLYYNG
jgi:uncharacterized DUF497 family protein